MNTDTPEQTASWDDLAAEYALGTLSPTERARFEGAMRADASLGALVEKWASRLAPLTDPTAEIAPPAELFARIEAAMDETPGVSAGTAMTVRQDEGEWVNYRPGVRKKRLYYDAVGRSEAFLLDMDPGAELPPHSHADTEDCLVISGDVRIGDLVLHAGDFHVAMGGSTHLAARTEGGCRLYLRNTPT